MSTQRISRKKDPVPRSQPPSQTITGLEADLCHPKGHLKACLLLLVEAKPAHGYELIDAVKPFGYQCHEPASVYRALRWLEGSGLVQASWDVAGGQGPARRVFSVTPEHDEWRTYAPPAC